MPLDTGHFMVGAAGLFAPTIRHHKGKFYIICTNFLEFKQPLKPQNFIISCTDIWARDWSDPAYIPFYGIDPSLFFDDDGRVYFQGCYTIDRSRQPSCTIKQFEIDVDTGKQLSEQREIWGGHAKYDTEGPHIYKIGKWYYLVVAEGGTFEHHMLCISRSENIWGPYEDYDGNPILTADGTDEYIQNLGHGELLQDGNGQWWVAALGVRNENEGEPLGKDNFVTPLGRESFLAPVEWPEGGWPKIAQPTMKFLAKPIRVADSLPGFTAPPNVGNLFIRTPDLSKYHVPDDNGSPLILHTSLNSLSTPTGTSAFLGRRQLSLKSVATATLDITNLRKGIEAGLALYKDHLRHVSITYSPVTGEVTCRAVSLDMDNKLLGQASVEVQTQKLRFRIVASPKKWTFLTQGILGTKASGDENWAEVGYVETWKLAAREMTGPLFGVFAHALDEQTESVAVTFPQFTIDDNRH
ncbi:xylosidase arabinosidase [Fusarium albosuccineum]|uniref:Xylosidase arabinosidase n=1 Tax=Fusarium albosuccineum TaxID=1237068 RepID=A0A8H4PG08_9HYPO|nr:xylosidase arabinosidase [Fusarium albosuccineum]